MLKEKNTSSIMSYTNPDDLEDGLEYEVDSSEEAPAVEIKDDDSSSAEEPSEESKSGAKKRRKTDNKLKEKKRLRMERDIDSKKNVPLQPSTELAHYFSQKLIKENSDSTHLDYFKKSDFVDGSNYKSKRNLDNFKEFTDKYNKGLTLIVGISRVRIGDLFKSLGPKSSAIKVIKGYDGKLRDDTKYILGTVERLLNLDFEEHEIKSIILDATFQDAKTHSVLDETKLTALLKKYQGTKIILY